MSENAHPSTGLAGAPGPARNTGWIASIRARAAPLAVTLFALVCVVIRIREAGKVATPFLLCDEFIYAGVARNLAATGEFRWRGQDLVVNPLYSALISPAWYLPSVTSAYAAAKALNVVLMTLAAIPFYRWARRFLSPWGAAAVTAVLLLLPEFALSGMLMSENASFPAILLALFAIACALERPSVLRQVGALVAIGLSCLSRQQGLVLLVILPTAIGLYSALAPAQGAAVRGMRRFVTNCRGYTFSFAALALLGGSYAVLCAILGKPLSTALGFYGAMGVATSGYPVWDVPRLAGLHLAALAAELGFVPLSALVILWTMAARRGSRVGPAERAFLAVTTSAVVWVLLQVAVFASRFTGGVIVGRYTFYLAPPLLLAGAIWMSRGLPRPPVFGVAAGLLPVAFALALPLPRIAERAFPNDFSLLALLPVAELLPSDFANRVTLVAWGVLAGSAFAWVPKRAARILLPASVCALFVASGWIAFAAMQTQSQRTRRVPGLGTDLDWVDAVLGADRHGAFLYSAGGDAWHASLRMLELEFWNRSIDRVLDYRDDEICPLPALKVDLEEPTGRVVLGPSPAKGPASSPHEGGIGDFIVAGSDLEVVGERLAERSSYSLFVIEPPFRLQSGTRGVFADGWMGSEASYSRYASAGAHPGLLEVRLSRRGLGRQPSQVSVEVHRLSVDGGTLGALFSVQAGTIEPQARRTKLTLATPPAPFRAIVRVWPTFPLRAGDTRQLGAVVRFRFVLGAPVPAS